MKNKKHKKKIKPKTEFSKKMLIALLVVSIIFTAMSYVLAWFDKNTVETLSIEILRIIWSVDGIGLLAYSTLNATRAYSLNKYNSNQINDKNSDKNNDKNDNQLYQNETNDTIENENDVIKHSRKRGE